MTRKSALDPLLANYRAQAVCCYKVHNGPWNLLVSLARNRRGRKAYTLDVRRRAVRDLFESDRRRFVEFGQTGIISVLARLSHADRKRFQGLV